MKSEFDHKKATQAINFFSEREGGKIDMMKVIKLIYFADRYHLRKYGRPVTNDGYWAMSYGPVGTTVKDIASFSQFLDNEELQYAVEYLTQGDSHFLLSQKKFDDKVFSDSDLEALEFAYNNFGKFGQFDLAEMTHKYPEWIKYKSALESRETTREEMNYFDFFLNPVSISDKDDPFSLPEEHLNDSKEIFQETCKEANRWYA